jgi:hypothetical protein
MPKSRRNASSTSSGVTRADAANPEPGLELSAAAHQRVRRAQLDETRSLVESEKEDLWRGFSGRRKVVEAASLPILAELREHMALGRKGRTLTKLRDQRLQYAITLHDLTEAEQRSLRTLVSIQKEILSVDFEIQEVDRLLQALDSPAKSGRSEPAGGITEVGIDPWDEGAVAETRHELIDPIMEWPQKEWAARTAFGSHTPILHAGQADVAGDH